MKTNQLIERLGAYCQEHHMTIVTAESCTGGGIAFRLSKSKICSKMLERGYVTYSNQSKEQLLQIKPESLQLHGAVSEIIAVEMAEGALKNSLAQVSVAVTGIAGEDMGDKNKKGIAWIGIAIIDQASVTKKIEFKGSREQFINFVILQCVNFLIHTLKI